MGLHARGCGDAAANKQYTIPPLSSREDTLNSVEDLICQEMALETAFEGYRYYDLLRIAIRRDDPEYLASRIADRSGSRNEVLYNKLMERRNWFLPLE